MTKQEQIRIKDICSFMRGLQEKIEPPFDINSIFKRLNITMIMLSKDISEDVAFSILRDDSNHYIVGIKECEDKKVEYIYKGLVLGFISLYQIEVGTILKIYKKEILNLETPANVVYFMEELLMPEDMFKKEANNSKIFGKMFIDALVDYFKVPSVIVKGWNYELFVSNN